MTGINNPHTMHMYILYTKPHACTHAFTETRTHSVMESHIRMHARTQAHARANTHTHTHTHTFTVQQSLGTSVLTLLVIDYEYKIKQRYYLPSVMFSRIVVPFLDGFPCRLVRH